MAFKARFPRWITAVLAIVQVVLTAAVIGLEFGSFYYDIAHGTIWAGFWSGLVFILTFLTMFCITCCCRGRYCATYVLVLNLISAGLGIVIIYFDIYFLSNLCKCYLGDLLCCAFRDINSFQSKSYGNVALNCTPITLNGIQTITDNCSSSPPTSKTVFLKAQIAAAAAMIVTCGLYVVAYLFACFGICFGHD